MPDPSSDLSDSIDHEASPVDPANPAPEARPRFCRNCGALLEPAAVACERCVPRAPMIAAPAARSPLRATFLLYLSLLSVSIIALIVRSAVGDTAPPATKARIDIGASLLFACVIIIAGIAARGHLRPALACIARPRYYLAALVLSIFTYTSASLLIRLAHDAIGAASYRYADPYTKAGYPAIAPFLIIAAMPAFFEELAFRGIIGPSLRGVLERREAILVTALLFAVLHLSPISFLHLFISGLALGILRERSGSLYPGMLLHFCHNGLVLVGELYPGISP